ncbi:MAG: amidohydrolase family protein [Myxococcota bacterium]
MTPLGFGIWDGDNHYYEPRDAFTRYIEPRYRDRAVRVIETDGRSQVWIGERAFHFLDDTFASFEKTVRPGSLREFLKSLGSDRLVEPESVEIPMDPAFQNRDARLARMDEQGVEAAFLFPTLGVCVEHFLREDVALSYANIRAFNRWLDETWGFAWRGRIFASPILSLLDPEEALRDLEDVLARGARLINVRTGPAGGRSPADPIFDRVWSLANEAKLAIAYHVGEAGYNEMMSTHWGEAANPASHHQSAFQWVCMYGDRPIMDTITALVMGNFFGRYPNIKALSVENGSLWVSYLLKAMDKMKGMGRNGPWLGGRVHGRASEIFKQHVWVNPYHEEDHKALAELVGVSHVVFGSDYPHAECVPHPEEFIAGIQKQFSAPDVRALMRENAQRLVGDA